MADVVKYGVQIANRIFVGGLAFDTKEEELRDFFQQHGKVKDCKIVSDKDGFSRGFGFITFESKQDAIQTQKLGTVFFNQKKLNLGPAIRQKGVVFSATQEAANEPVASAGVYIHPSGYAYTVAPNGVWYFHEGGADESPSNTPQNGAPHAPVAQSQIPPPQVAQTQMPTQDMTLGATQGNTAPVQISASNVAHLPAAMPAQSPPAILPMKLIPADNLTPQSCPVYAHYIVPQNMAVQNTNGPDPQPRFYGDANVMPYYFPQPQPQLPQMNVYPISTPPSQIHHVSPPSVHVIPGQFARPAYPAPPRPEVYQIYSAPYDPSIIEHGPFIYQNNKANTTGILKPAMVRPTGPLKKVTAEYPPYRTQPRRNDIASSSLHRNGIRVGTGSGGSTPASSSSSGTDGCSEGNNETM